jgi:ATP-dependent helicase HrpB
MWSAADEAGLVPFNTPEILATDLAALALHLAAAGVRRPDHLRWLDPPPESSWNQAIELLALMGAIDREGRITPRGRAMADLPIHPRLGHMMIEARRLQLGSLAAELAALLSDRDIARSDAGAEADADIRLRLEALRRGRGVPGLTVDHGALRRAQAEAAEWRRRLHARGTAAESEAGRLLALAYPDRIARSRGGAGRFLLRNGRGARLGPGQSLAWSEWIVAADLDDAGSESLIRTAAPLEPDVMEELARDAESADEIVWDEGTASVRARRIRRLGAIVIDERSLPRPDPEQVKVVLLRAIASAGIERLPWGDEALLLRRRLAFLHRVDPDWRDVSDQALLAALDQWLGPEVEGMHRLEELTSARLKQALSRLVPPDRRSALDRLAPERIEVPSGSRIAIDYSDPERPVLAVRLQEVFGLRATPRIAGGRVSLTLHLLSPAYRPVQVTRDLESFWKTGYFEVRKDLRGRYPKHPWPDDPLTAPAGRRGRR